MFISTTLIKIPVGLALSGDFNESGSIMVELFRHIGAGKGHLIGTLFDPSSLVMSVGPGISCAFAP